MKKTSKILSLLVALCMAVTMLSGLTVFAEDPFELVSYDADADFITLDFNQEIDTVDSTIVLTKGGDSVPFTIAKNDATSSVQAETSSRYTYLVTPTDGNGIELEAEYKITFWEVKSADGASTLPQSAMSFTVAELANDADLVDFNPYEEDNNNTWIRNETTGGLKIDPFTFGASRAMATMSHAGALVGADDDEEHALPSKTATTGTGTWTEKDYTVKVTLKSGTELKRADLYFGIARNLTDINSTVTSGTTASDVTALRTYCNADADASASQPALYLHNGTIARSSSLAAEYLAKAKAPILDYTSGVEFKLSSKNDVVRAFIDGAKTMDAAVTVAPGHPFLSIYPKGTGTTTLELYDFQVTQSTFEATDDLDYPEGYEPPAPEEPENPELVGAWDADLDFVSIDFTEEIGTLEATLTQAGTQVPVTVSLANHENYDSEVAPDARYTYIIKPVTGGIVRNTPYTVTIANVENADGSKKLSTWSKTFRVEVLAEGTDIADWDATTMTSSQYNNAGTYGLEVSGREVAGNDVIDVTAPKYTGTISSSRYVQVGRPVGTDATVSTSAAEQDYTIKMTFADNGGTKNMNFALGVTNTTRYKYGSDNFRGVWSYGQVNEYGNSTFIFGENSNGTVVKEEYKNTVAVDRTAGFEVKVAIKDQYAKGYVNDGKLADLELSADRPGFAFFCTNPVGVELTESDSVATVSNFVATRAVAITTLVDEFAPTEPEITAGGFSEETVSIATKIVNNTGSAKTIFAVCALYDATGAMKNIVISRVGSATIGETDLVFNGVNTNGATYAKVFIWNSATALDPYFPAIIVE